VTRGGNGSVTRARARRKIELLPIWLDEAENRGPIDADRARGTVERVAECPEKFGTSFRANGGVVEIV
jgi:hypothetical protein